MDILSFTTISPGRVNSQLPPPSAAISTMTEPDFISAIISASINTGAGRPGMAAVVITKSASLTALCIVCRALSCDVADSSRA